MSPAALEYRRRENAYAEANRALPMTPEADAVIDAECGALDALWYALSDADRAELNDEDLEREQRATLARADVEMDAELAAYQELS